MAEGPAWGAWAIGGRLLNRMNYKDYRGERIRTSDLIVPNDARYQAAPHPEKSPQDLSNFRRKDESQSFKNKRF